MSDLDKEMDDALDALEVDSLDSDDPIVSDAELVEVEHAEIEPEEKKKPPGYMGYEDWVNAGKDPAEFKGEKAYKAEYERIQEIKDLKSTMSQVVDGMNEWKQQQTQQTQIQIEQAREDAKAELERARDDADIDKALAAQKKIDKIDNLGNQERTPTENPIITDFYKKNPIIDRASSQYDQDFYDDCSMMQHAIINKLTGGDPQIVAKITPAQLERSMNVAFEEAKKLHPTKFSSKRNNRQQAPSSTKRATPKTGDYATRLKSLGGNSRNQNDSTPAYDLYQIIKESHPEEAEKFAKNTLGE